MIALPTNQEMRTIGGFAPARKYFVLRDIYLKF